MRKCAACTTARGALSRGRRAEVPPDKRPAAKERPGRGRARRRRSLMRLPEKGRVRQMEGATMILTPDSRAGKSVGGEGSGRTVALSPPPITRGAAQIGRVFSVRADFPEIVSALRPVRYSALRRQGRGGPTRNSGFRRIFAGTGRGTLALSLAPSVYECRSVSAPVLFPCRRAPSGALTCSHNPVRGDDNDEAVCVLQARFWPPACSC